MENLYANILEENLEIYFEHYTKSHFHGLLSFKEYIDMYKQIKTRGNQYGKK